jgi:DnaJ domain
MNEKTSFPLTWPEGWPRTERHKITSSRFTRNCNYSSRNHSMDEARRALATELERLGARDAILSTNIKIRIDGNPYSGQAQPNDRGAAVYFALKGKPISLACDRWDRVEDNIWAIVKHIESLRGQDRWGVGNIEQAFRGYMALPGVGQTAGFNWWEVLGVPVNSSADQTKEAYKILVKKHHPDAGGNAELFRRVQEAFEQFERLVSQ